MAENGETAPFFTAVIGTAYGRNLSALFFLLRRQAARPPKKTPARVNAQMVMVTANSLVVIMGPPRYGSR
jgi:hypothetical protein